MGLAYQCFRLALSTDNSHAEAFNNLGVLEQRRGHPEQARAFFQAAASLSPYLHEPQYNMGILSYSVCKCRFHSTRYTFLALTSVQYNVGGSCGKCIAVL